ncbi:DUF2732 family protein [Hafnia sp.]|uniref:DUF2732 family protein n=1 Tax=Hafnia sp. TaxID=1873498 RepID=UPI002FCB7ACD
MQNIEVQKTPSHGAQLLTALNDARIDERRNQAELVSARMNKLAGHIITHEMSSRDAAELLRQEAERVQNLIGEMH